MSRPEIERRRVLGLLGGAGLGAMWLGACRGEQKQGSTAGGPTSARTGGTSDATAPQGVAPSAPLTAEAFGGAASCRLTPQQTQGPYYLDVDKIRGDIREDRQGTPLRVATRVLHADGCTPVRDAVFEIWHCDAGGLYSGFEQASLGRGPAPGAGASDTKRYLRGAQVTDPDGIAQILTIYPGWYRGRTVHIHAKVHISNDDVLTTQLYFDDKLTEQVHRAPPYDAHRGRDTSNNDDAIFDKKTVLTVTKEGDGYLGLITIGVSA